jgi:hypothetical protein
MKREEIAARELEIEKRYGKDWSRLTSKQKEEIRELMGSVKKTKKDVKINSIPIADAAQSEVIYRQQNDAQIRSFCKKVSDNISILK